MMGRKTIILAALLTAATVQATTHMDAAVWAAKNGYRLVPEPEIVELSYDLPNNGHPVRWMEIQVRWLVDWPEFDPAWADTADIKGWLKFWAGGQSPKFSTRSVAGDSVTVGPWTYWQVGTTVDEQ